MPPDPKYSCATKDRCSGDCCERFFIARDPRSFRDAYLAHLDGKPVDQNAVFAHMFFVPIENFDGVKMEDLTPADAEKLRMGAYYTCRHFDTVKRECSIYERRPPICRGYGTTSPCHHDACTWKDAFRGHTGPMSKITLSDIARSKFTDETQALLDEQVNESAPRE